MGTPVLRVCLTEREIHDRFLQSLARRQLRELFFYWFPSSVLAWLRLCASRRYRNYARSLILCQRAAPWLSAQLPASRAIQWISVGCGQGVKEVPFLRAAVRRRLRLAYIPWDASQTLLETACARALPLGVPTLGMKADVEEAAHWGHLPLRRPGQVRVLSVFGNTLGALGLRRFLDRADGVLARGDWLLMDGELFAGEETLAGYDHPANRAFVTAPLRAVGVTDADGEVQFALRAPDSRWPVGSVRKQFLFRRATTVHVAGQVVRFRRGDRIAMSPSDKYAVDGMTRHLAEDGRFAVADRLLSPDRRFALWLCRKRALSQPP